MIQSLGTTYLATLRTLENASANVQVLFLKGIPGSPAILSDHWTGIKLGG